MLASLGLIGLGNIHEMNTLKTILGSLINLVAAAWFAWANLVDWPKAGVMLVGALAGYFLGSHFSQRIPQKRVRQMITAIGLSLSVMIFTNSLFIKTRDPVEELAAGRRLREPRKRSSTYDQGLPFYAGGLA